jgi:hypothetical protein
MKREPQSGKPRKSTGELRYQLFPRSVGLSQELRSIIEAFEAVHAGIKSPDNTLNSDGVLRLLRPGLERLNFRIESGKTKGDKIPVPVLFGINNKIDRAFSADGLSADGRIVLEVEAGRAVINYGFLKDIFQACMMHGVEFLVLAVRNDYQGNDDFRKVHSFLETLYISSRIQLPLRGIVVIGY